MMLSNFLHDVVKKQGCEVIQMETDKDHIHILFEYSPKASVSNIVKQLKQHSTYLNSIGNTKYFCLMDILLVV